MAKKNINIGQSVNDKTGDTLRSAFDKINQNFTELYNATGGGLDLLAVASNIVPDTDNTRTLGTPTKRWGHLYVGPGSISIGNAELTLEGGKIKSSTGFKLTDSQLDDVLPSQTGNAGKFLTTDGTHTLSWAAAAGGGGVTSYTALTDKPTIPAAQIQSDWTQASNVALDFIKNKPALFSGSYADLTNKPTIPAAQVQTDWNAVSGLAVVLNKPALFSGSYTDLTNKPTIPTSFSSLVNSTKTVSLASTGVLSLPAQALPIQTFNQITTATINRTGASTDTDAIADARDNWLGAEYAWTEMVEQDHQISGYTWPWRGKPSWEGYPLLMNYNSSGPGAPTPPFGTLPPSSSLAPAGHTAINAYLAYKELASSIDIVSGNKTFSFENTGALRVPDIITRDNNLALVSSGATGVLPNGMAASVTADGQYGRVFIRTDSGTLRTWQFDVNGNTTFPTGLVLGAPRGVGTVNFTCSVDKEFQIETGTASAGRLWQFGTTGTTTFPSGLTLHRLSSSYSNITADLNKILQVATQTSGGRKEWSFGTDGATTFPDGTEYTGQDIRPPVDGGLGIALNRNLELSAVAAVNSGQGQLYIDTSTNNDTSEVDIFWQLNTGTFGVPVLTPITSVITPTPGVRRISVTGVTFVVGQTYTFRRDLIDSVSWLFQSDGALRTSGYGTISHYPGLTSSLKLEVPGNNNIVLRTTGGDWQFGSDGKLTAPGNLQVNGGKIILNSGGNAYVESVDYGVNSANSAVNIFGGPYQKIKLRAGFGTEATWTYGTNGSLSLPSNGSIASGLNTAQVGSSKRISFGDGGQGNYMAYGATVLSVGYADNVDILTTFAAGSTITFTNGDVRTITAITAGVANAYIDIAWTGAIADYLTVPAFPITLKTANFAAATTAPLWRFGNTAALTLPNNAFIKQSENTDISTALTAYNTAVTAWETTRKNEFVYSVLNDLPGLMSFAGWPFATWDDVSGTNAAAYLAIVNNAYTVQNNPSSPPTPLVFTPALTSNMYTQLQSLLTAVINTYAAWQELLTSVDIWAGNEKLSLLSNNKIQVPGIIQTDVEEDLIIRTRYAGVTSPPAGSGQLSYANKDFVFGTNGSLTFQKYEGVTTGNAVIQGDTSGNLNLTGGNYVNIESTQNARINIATTTANTGVDMGNSTSPVRLFGDLQMMSGRSMTTQSTTFNLINTTATTVNAFGAATTLNMGAAGGTTTIAGDLVVNGTTTTINSTTLTVDDKNIELGSVASPTDAAADGGGITLKGTTDKTFTYVNSTGLWTANIGVQATSFTGLAATAVTASTASSLGYLGMPQNAKSSSSNTVIGDQGKHIYITGPTTITIDGSLDYPIGATIAFINSTSTATIAITTNTMVLGGVGTTGSRSLAPYGMATAVKVTATTWYINGVGLT
jgi:hypothetical protein